jgi:hypothetical protein
MASHYSVVQFVPDPVADERINIGVLVFGQGRVGSTFVSDWRRAQTLAGHSVEPLRRILRDLQRVTSEADGEAALTSPSEFHRLTVERVEQLAAQWSHAIQLTPPRASLAEPDALLSQMASLMLKQRVPRRRAQSKLTLVREARLHLERELAKRDALNESGREVEQRVMVPGKLVPHEVDLVVRNGKPLIAAQAISFSRVPSGQLQKEINATAWVLDDIGQAKEHPELAVIVTEPRKDTRMEFDEAMKLFGKLADRVIRPKEIGEWSEHAVDVALA